MFTFFLSIALLPVWPGAPEWLSTRVLACGIVAVALVVLSLLLKGLQKVIMLLIAAAVVLGGFWFVQDTWAREEVVPAELAAELNGLAAQALKQPEAKAAWQRAQAEWSKLSGDARARLAAGGDEARAAIGRHLDAKAAELRREGKKSAADELNRLKKKVTPAE